MSMTTEELYLSNDDDNEWYEVESTADTKPKEVETGISDTTVFLRRNIKRVHIDEDAESGRMEQDVWQYEEMKIARADYELYLGKKNEANIEFIAMMSDIDLDE